MAGGARDLVFTVLGIDRASKTFNEVGDSLDRLTTRGSSAIKGLAASSAASSLAVAGAVAAIPLAFAGIGAAALAQNTAVRSSFQGLSQTVKSGLMADAAPLEHSFVGAAERIGGAFNQMRPQLRQAFADSAPAVEALTGGVVGLAQNAMPGMLSVVGRSTPVFQALEVVLKATGTGASDFLEIVSRGAPDAAQGLESFGVIAQGVLPEVGNMLVGLSGLWAEHGDQVARVVVRLVGVMGDLGGNALPVVSSAMGVALDVLEGVLAVVGPLADKLGPLIGMWLSLSLAFRTVGAASGVLTSIATSMQAFRTGVEQAAGAGGGGMTKFQAAGKAAFGMLGGPWGIAIGAAITMLALFGQQSQKAASEQRSLADALRESGGEFTGEARRLLYNSEAYKAIASGVDAAKIGHTQMLDALVEGGPKLDMYIGKLEALTASSEAGGSTTTLWRDNIADLRSMMAAATEDALREAEATDAVARSMFGGVPGAEELSEALATLDKNTASTADHADALNTAWRRLFGQSLDMVEAVAEFEGGLDRLRGQIDEAKEKSHDWRAAMVAADGSLVATTETGRQLTSALIDQGETYRTLVQTVYDAELARTHSEERAAAAATAASQQRRAQFVAEAVQMGFTEHQAQLFANSLLGIPRDVVSTIQLKGIGEAQRAVDRFITDNMGRTIRVNVTTGARVGLPMLAEGGPAKARQPYIVGERGQELFVPDTNGVVIPADQTRQILAGANSADRAMRMTGGPGGPAAVHVVNTVRYEMGSVDSDLVRALVKALRVHVDSSAGGSVQKALGS